MENNKAEQILTAPGAQKKIKKVVLESQKKVDSEKSTSASDNFKSALLAFLPAIAGGLFEGSAGAARGAEKSLDILQKDVDRKIQTDQQSQQNAQFKQNLEAEGILADQRLAEEKRQFDTMTGFKAMESMGAQENLNAEQAKSRQFAREAEQASTEYDSAIKQTGFSPTGKSATAQIVGQYLLPKQLEGLGQTEGFARTLQAKRSFINSVLRPQSGAVLGEEEIATAEAALFPSPGESEAVVAQKERARKLVIKTLQERGQLVTAGEVSTMSAATQEALRRGLIK